MAAFDDAVAIFFASWGGFDRQTLLSGLPQTTTDDHGRPITIPGYFGPAQQGPLDGGSPMPYPQPLTGGQAYKMTFYINCGIHGWSESLRWYVTNSSKPMTKMFALADLIATDRKGYLHVTGNIAGIRVTETKKGGASLLRKKSTDGCGPGSVTGTLDQVSNCLWLRGSDATTASKETLYYHGFKQGFLKIDSDSQNGVMDPTPQMLGFRDAMKARIVQEYTAYEGTAVPCIKTYQRDPATNPPKEILSFGVDASGFLTATMNGDPFALLDTSVSLKVSATRTNWARGISGKRRIIGQALVGGNRVYTFSKRPRCLTANLTGLVGSAVLDGPVYVRVTDLDIGGVGDHQVGRPFGVSAGRRSARS